MRYRDRLYKVALAVFVVCVGLLASVSTHPASAEGLAKSGTAIAAAAQPLQAPIPETAVAPFTGLYGSVGGGYGLTGLETTFFDYYKPVDNGTEDSRLAHGWRGDGRLGLDYQTGSLVFGVLGGYGFGESRFEDSRGHSPIAITVRPTWYVGGRVGIASGKTLWYGGAAWQHAELDAKGPGPFDRDIEGVKALLGVEHQITSQIALALEVGNTWYEAVSNQVEERPGVRYEPTDTEVMLRLNWRPFGK